MPRVSNTHAHIPTQMDGVLCRCCIFHVCRYVGGKTRSGLSSAASAVVPLFTRCCSQLLHQRCSAALSVSNAPFKIGPLFLTLWWFNNASRLKLGSRGAEYILNSCSFKTILSFLEFTLVHVDLHTVLLMLARVLVQYVVLFQLLTQETALFLFCAND